MPVLQPRHSILPDPPPADDAPVPRLVSGEEDPVFSPVHALQQELLPLAQGNAQAAGTLYPLWLRVAIIGGSSAFAWALIIWGMLRLH
ncbi:MULTISPECIES: hypothetical protein [unclassified Novosphingobium]|uniref:hypothetical protein n=1 Tax=unclassified Novosphingobium TaxID=2644732 RepID=UPI000D42C3BF|nr:MULTISPECIES: hypothetical protein [unclassified Novosphingobium]PTR12149.1 hypothetical protein C8K11_10371 [Novosphingobium sp. GV055]PUB05550.1 hypothetical protein C8K12_10371 [Novosphingobium sp. GV061]PUB21783.1 hypothetical protein C8K14_10371 [Novosphingobium sp. GV079]PUB43556.1 hypothetical protein C8K10_10371 [Novosphingobium sp. GV027]